MTVLLYHDVLGDPRAPASGFDGADAEIYKLSRSSFEAHLAALATTPAVFSGTAQTLPDALSRRAEVVLSFDDGGASAWPVTGEALGRRGWHGLFFITTDRIGSTGFLEGAGIRALRAAGHLVGSHSASHPPRMAALGRDALLREWRESRARLEDLLGEPVRIASVPGGYHSRAVADAAEASGYDVLFTSEPRRMPWRSGRLLVAGRFSIMRDTPPAAAAALGTGRLLACAGQAARWNAKKLLKAVGGRAWLGFRKRYWAWNAGPGASPRR